MHYTNLKIIKLLKDHPPFSPVLKLVELNGQKMVWKDYSSRSWWVKDIWGKILISHECRILKHLAGIKGIPRVISKIDKYGFLCEYIEGEPLNKFKAETLSPIIFERLTQLVIQIHERGVVHLDLGQRRNILLDKDYQPYFIDFATAVYFRSYLMGSRVLFNLLCLIDHSALLKFKHRFFPHLLSSREKQQLRWFFFSRRFWIFKPKKFRPKDRI